jgi:hypothetical protein
MKKHLAAICVLAFGAQASLGALLVSDNFDRAAGNLVGTTSTSGGVWGTHSGAGVGPVQINNNRIAIVQGTGYNEDVNIPLGKTMAAGDVFYSAFDLTLDAAANPSNVYFAMFMAGTSSFDGRIWATAPTTSGYRLALSNDNSITDADGEVFSGDLAFGTTYRIVHSYDFSAKKGTLWISPVDQTSPSLTATDAGYSDAITSYAFRQAGGNSTQYIDNLAVGTSFADVVPEPASLMLLGLGGLFLRRRRH